MTATTRRGILAAVPAAACIPPYRDLGADDPLLGIERALREAEGAAQRAYALVDGAADREAALVAYEALAEVEDRLREQLAETPPVSVAGAAAKLRMAAAEMAVAGCDGPALDAVRTVLDYIERRSGQSST